jgi:hypothetical protein
MAERTVAERVWLFGFPLLIVVGAFVGYRIVVNGIDTILASNDGEVIDAQSDPASPRFRLIVEPTETGAVAFTDGSALISVAVLLPAGEVGGTWIVIPPSAIGPTGATLAATFAESEGELFSTVESMISVGLTHTSVLSPEATAVLVDPVAPIEIVLADALATSDAAVFGPGETAVAARDFSSVLGWLNEGESAGNRLTRQQDLMTAWFDAMQPGASGQVGEIEPDEVRSLIESMAAGPVVIEPPPISGTAPVSNGEGFLIDEEALGSRVRILVPFALPAATVELPRALVLNGASNDLDLTTGAARRVAAVGAHVTAIGNAENFLQEQSVISYTAPAMAEVAAALADALGIERVELDADASRAFDVIVVIGKDWSASQ